MTSEGALPVATMTSGIRVDDTCSAVGESAPSLLPGRDGGCQEEYGSAKGLPRRQSMEWYSLDTTCDRVDLMNEKGYEF